MRLPNFDYRDPAALEEVLSILEELRGEARVLAGGTDLLPLMKYGLTHPSTLISLKNVTELQGIKRLEQEIFIGAMTSLADLSASSLIKDRLPALHQAVETVAAPPLWNVATVGGNIRQNTRCLYYNQSKVWRLERPPCYKAGGDCCHAVLQGKKCFSVYCGDLAPALMTLGSRLSVKRKNQERIIPLQDLFTGNGLNPFTLADDELITGVIIPLTGGRDGSSYVKMRLRPAVDYPLLSAAASLTLGEGGRIEKARLILGAVGPIPVEVETDPLFPDGAFDRIPPDAFRKMLGHRTPLADNLALPGSYRRKMLPVIAGKAIQGALRSIREKEQL
jgi:4-hydroxybenzoyl-CoA reductase beta subunit